MPRLPAAPLSIERHLAEPVMLADDIEHLVGRLAATLKTDMERRGEGARTLALVLFRVDGAVSRLAVGTSRPLREPSLIRRLFHERLAALGQDLDAGYGFDLIRLSVLSAASFRIEQADLAGEANEDDTGLALLADRIRARLGDRAILKPVAVESHLPERAVATVPFAETAPQGARPSERPGRMKRPPSTPPFRQERPVRIFRFPEPIEVPATEMPEGPPLRFRWRRALHRVARSEGPERIAPEWWLERIPEVKEGKDPEEVRKQAVMMKTARSTRDYFRVEDVEGRRYWLYRQGLYDGTQPPPRWFMHGLFA